MENVIQLIHEFFTKFDIAYEYDEKKKVFSSGINMGGVLGNLRLLISVHEDSYIVYAILHNVPEKEFYGEVAEYLHRANYGLLNGNFEFDYRDGEVRYKSFVNFDGAQLSIDIIIQSIATPVLMFDRYGKNLLRVMMGDGDPAELLRKAEEQAED